MTDKFRRPEYIELSPAEIEWHMQRGRQLRSQAAFELMNGLASYIRRVVKAVASARYLADNARVRDRRIRV